MEIVLGSEQEREQLQTMGEIVIFRPQKIKYSESDWITDEVGGKKICDVLIDIEGENVALHDLSDYVENSGFKTLKNWVFKIKQLYKYNENTKGFMYYVALNKDKTA